MDPMEPSNEIVPASIEISEERFAAEVERYLAARATAVTTQTPDALFGRAKELLDRRVTVPVKWLAEDRTAETDAAAIRHLEGTLQVLITDGWGQYTTYAQGAQSLADALRTASVRGYGDDSSSRDARIYLDLLVMALTGRQIPASEWDVAKGRTFEDVQHLIAAATGFIRHLNEA